jgi:hypothetical protein
VGLGQDGQRRGRRAWAEGGHVVGALVRAQAAAREVVLHLRMTPADDRAGQGAGLDAMAAPVDAMVGAGGTDVAASGVAGEWTGAGGGLGSRARHSSFFETSVFKY